MITAKNYAAQAEASLIVIANYAPNLIAIPDDCKTLLSIAFTIKNAVHFVLPDSGFIFNDGLKGIMGRDIKLPFPAITIEFISTDGSKVLLLVEEIKNVKVGNELIFGHLKNNNGIKVISILKQLKNHWEPEPYGFLMPHFHKPNEDGSFNITGGSIEVLSNHSQLYTNDDIEASRLNARLSAYFVLELIEALSCRNVEASIHQPASPKNTQRLKSHKLPIYETRFLTIKPTVKEYDKNGKVSTHASPRQHLRRGHIRRLDSGNIWVNSCVVGDSSKGIIDKTYKIIP